MPLPPHCQSSSRTEREGRTVHGFRRFTASRYQAPVPGVRVAIQRAHRQGVEPGPVPDRHRVPGRFLRLRYKLSQHDLAEMFLIRDIMFTHEAVRDWEAKLAPLLAEELHQRRAPARLLTACSEG
jgi:putative transposase